MGMPTAEVDAASREQKPDARSRKVEKMKILLAMAALLVLVGDAASQSEWPSYGGTGGTHYSTLEQINRSNVHNLIVAWTYDTKEEGGLETSPIIVDGVLYGITDCRFGKTIRVMNNTETAASWWASGIPSTHSMLAPAS